MKGFRIKKNIQTTKTFIVDPVSRPNLKKPKLKLKLINKVHKINRFHNQA